MVRFQPAQEGVAEDVFEFMASFLKVERGGQDEI
jgi:hypothetical protein